MSDSLHRHRSGPTLSASSRSPEPSVTSTAQPIILQRSSCVCGGGCPQCHAGVLQRKLRISEPGDRYEQEADRVAEAVMRKPNVPPGRQFEGRERIEGSRPAVSSAHDASEQEADRIADQVARGANSQASVGANSVALPPAHERGLAPTQTAGGRGSRLPA